MFTGIIEEIGVIKKITKGANSAKLLIQCNKVLEETKLGDSICTNGVCLTVTEINDHSFQADVMAETLLRSNLGNLTLGSEVNILARSSFLKEITPNAKKYVLKNIMSD